MEAPKLAELQDFTLEQYIKLIKYLKQNRRIIQFRDVRFEDTPYLILRHDIDISLPDALRMAKIEKELDVKSTYFVLFSSRFYNPFEGRNIEIIKEISALGHEIGLHYYPKQYRQYKEAPKKTLQIQAQILECFTGKKICSISRHGSIDFDPFSKSTQYINANHPYFRAGLFLHDSDRAWVTLNGLNTLLTNPPERVQLLIHPENWQKGKYQREELLEKHFQNLDNEIKNIKDGLFKSYREDTLAKDYDRALETFNRNSSNALEPKSGNQSNHRTTTLFRYYFNQSKIGWNLNKLRQKIIK